MKTCLVALAAALMLASSAAIAKDGSCKMGMTIEDARKLHESRSSVTCQYAIDLVKKDLKGCLVFYEQTDCEGPAADWVKKWKNLKPPLPSLFLPKSFVPKPSFWSVHVPFSKSAIDYVDENSLGSSTRVR